MANTENISEYSDGERKDLGLFVTLVSFGMLFAALFLSYALFRLQQSSWQPFGFEDFNLQVPSLSTFLILLSSCTLIWFRNTRTKISLSLTLLLALGFLLTQFYLWDHLKEIGFYVGSGIFSSIVYAFTWIHAAHIGLGLLGLLFLIPSINKKEKYEYRVKSIEYFWHFMGIIWGIMFLILFII